MWQSGWNIIIRTTLRGRYKRENGLDNKRLAFLEGRYTREEWRTTKEEENVSAQYNLALLRKQTHEGKEDRVGWRTFPWIVGLTLGGFPIVRNFISIQTNKLGVWLKYYQAFWVQALQFLFWLFIYKNFNFDNLCLIQFSI